MKTVPSKRKLRARMDQLRDEEDDGDKSSLAPAWWEMVMFRFLNAAMVIFFLMVTVRLQSDDNACLWIPTFLVPAFLSTIVAVRPQLSGLSLDVIIIN